MNKAVSNGGVSLSEEQVGDVAKDERQEELIGVLSGMIAVPK